MPRAIYVPVFDSFFESSIMREELSVRFVMLALIRLAWRAGANGDVDVDPLIFAQSINVPLADVESAIKRLMEPDPSSASPDEDGRRIIPLNPDRPFRGWRLVNWPRYRVMVNRFNDAERKRDEYHANKDTSKISESLQNSPGSPKVSGFRDNLVTRRNEYETKRIPPIPPTGGFEVFWGLYPKRVAKKAALKAWVGLVEADQATATKAVASWPFDMREDGRFVPHASSWLNQRRWEDDGIVDPVKSRREARDAEERRKSDELYEKNRKEAAQLEKDRTEYQRLLKEDPAKAAVFKAAFDARKEEP